MLARLGAQAFKQTPRAVMQAQAKRAISVQVRRTLEVNVREVTLERASPYCMDLRTQSKRVTSQSSSIPDSWRVASMCTASKVCGTSVVCFTLNVISCI